MSDHLMWPSVSAFRKHALLITYSCAITSGFVQFFGFIAGRTFSFIDLVVQRHFAAIVSAIFLLVWAVSVVAVVSRGKLGKSALAIFSLPLAIPYFLLWAWFFFGTLLTGQPLDL